ncbi:helix-turn-helix transcriptional regulator [Vibrio viridaestus]|uniref:XRE family transcriptional regulator n=1 Tax=Vibrio viridaestus TaxID=2487322 RepID=A0A3N9TEF2_9VIBR|nr:helix-turn-helix transcriptional regulator [Vibrio viridaestus]RQW62611.1 XRE family transcriptional regulator [Vibrio viridaestus]
MTTKILNQNERLGEFLRLKRNSIAPETLGLMKPARSRTPGLRREDIAEMANISTVWYSKLERGKAERVSRNVILAIAKSMRCDDSETRYLLQLSGHTDMTKQPQVSHSVAKEVEVLLNSLNPLPAILTNDFRDILATNSAFEAMVGLNLNELPEQQRNIIWLMSHNKQWQVWLKADNPAGLTDCMTNSAARIRAAMVTRASDKEWQERLDSLISECPLFEQIWSGHGVRAKEELEREYHHHSLGPIRMSKQYWANCSGNAYGQLLVYIPLDDNDKTRLMAL